NEDLSAQIMAQAQRSRMSPEQYAQQLQQGGNIAEFVAERRAKGHAIDSKLLMLMAGPVLEDPGQ
ncbi:MAG: trigger factor, partial [Vicinamibacteria bacterium]